MKYLKKLITFNILLLAIISYNYSNANNLKDVAGVINAVNHINTAHWWEKRSNIIISWNNVTVTCDNWRNAWTVSLTPADIKTVVDNIWRRADIILYAPPPPEPVITTTYSDSTTSWCSSYISWWNPNWSNCDADWNKWNNSWDINCKQVNTWSSVSNSCWSQTCSTTTTCVDWSCSSSTSCWPCSWCPSDTPKPSDVTETKTVSINLSDTDTDTYNAYANNSDTNKINITISAVTNDNKLVVNLPNQITDIKDASSLWVNRINNSWDSPIYISNTTSSIPSSFSRSAVFNISWVKSIAPLKTNNWKISFKLWWTSMEITNIYYNFKKPFIWRIDIIDSDWKIDLWTSNKFEINYTENKSIDESWLDIKNDINNIRAHDESNHKVVSKSVNNTDNTFEATINTSSTATSLSSPWIKLDKPPIISYNFWWKRITYYLNSHDEDEWNNSSALTNNNWKEFIWAKIVWNLQWAWKQIITWQNENFSDISKTDLRTQIRKNAYNYISSMSSWQIVNWVKYIVWDTELSWDISWYETLVVKDWNVTITWDLNTAWKKLWIIVLKDWYNVDNWYNAWKTWNIYITPNVTKINWVLYADWWLMSVDSNWSVYIKDNFSRTKDLKKQLILNWSLFTRNTIWWAILAWDNYIIPWGKKISWDDVNFFKAMSYDLNYVRRWNVWCDKSIPANNNCTDSWEYTDAFIIKYNPNLQANPPKLFEIK